MTQSFISVNSSIISAKFIKFCYIKKYRYRLHFDTFYIVTFSIMSAKMATQDLSEIKISKRNFKKRLCVVFYVNNVTNKTLLRDSSYAVDVVMSPKFGTSSISI